MPSALVRAQLAKAAPRHALLLAAAAALIAHSLRFGFVTDDAYISFVYARNLAEHGALVFNPGLPPVEGYTNFLWTAILGGLGWLGVPIPAAALVLGTVAAVGTLVVVWRLGGALLASDATPAGSPWAAVAPALLAASAGFACWSSGGLETQLFTFLVILAIDLALVAPRGVAHVGWVLALAAMTRPEGLLVAGAIALHRAAWNLATERRLRPSRDEALAIVGFALLWAPWFAWRWWYYGWPLPNTAYVKAAGAAAPGYDEKMHAAGRYYVGQWLRQTGLWYGLPLVAVGLGGVRRGSPRLRFATLAAPLAGLYLAYTVRVGGDFMGLHRFVMPLFPLAALATALGLERLAAAAPRGRARVAVAVALPLAVVATFALGQQALTARSIRPDNLASDRGIDTPAFLDVYARDRARIGQAMRACFRPDDFAIYGGAGAKPYFARLAGIDVFGLVSDRVAHEVPRTRPRAGHNKFAPDRLLAELEPTFVFSCYELARTAKPPRLPCDVGFWTARGYQVATMRIPGLIERGEYYSFLVRADRGFRCPGLVE